MNSLRSGRGRDGVSRGKNTFDLLLLVGSFVRAYVKDIPGKRQPEGGHRIFSH